MDYFKFLNLTLQRWQRFVIVQNVSLLVTQEKLEAYFRKFGEIERIWFIHNPESGCFMQKALILMKSPRSAALIIDKVHHRYSTDAIPLLETAVDEFVTTVKYRGCVKMYKHGLFDLHLELTLPWEQDSQEDRTAMGLYLTRQLVRAYRGLIFTSISLKTDYRCKYYKYTGKAIVSFQNKFDKEKVLERTKEQLNVPFRWVDTVLDGEVFSSEEVSSEEVSSDEVSSDEVSSGDVSGDEVGEGASSDEVGEGASEKVEGGVEGGDVDVEGDMESDEEDRDEDSSM